MEDTESTTEESVKAPTFKIDDLEVTSEPYSGLQKTGFKLNATIHVKEPEFQHKNYLLVLGENVTDSFSYVTVAAGSGRFEIFGLKSGSKSRAKSDPELIKVSLIGYVELTPGILFVGNSLATVRPTVNTGPPNDYNQDVNSARSPFLWIREAISRRPDHSDVQPILKPAEQKEKMSGE